MDKNDKFYKILSFFELDSDPVSVEILGNGHINKTYEVMTEKSGHYVLQLVNNYVFRDIDLLMNNIFYVSSYLISKGIESLEIVKTKTGKLYLRYENQICRVYLYTENTICFEKIDSDSPMISECSEAYGDLHMNLANLDATKIGEVIPNFHNTPKRYENFKESLKVNFENRIKNCEQEISEIHSFNKYFGLIIEGIKNHDIHLIVTHNDPKINNVLFDAKTLKFRAVIDLDTIMPGSLLYDFGDALRSLFTGDNECNKDLSKIQVNMNLYKRYLIGYIKKMNGVLTKREIELLPFSIFLLAIELSMRFLEDYLRGDCYFGVKEKDDNLTRARTQLSLAKKVMDKIDEMNILTKEIIDDFNKSN